MFTRIATESDIDGILTLQSKNLYINLSIEERAHGFVTTPFTIFAPRFPIGVTFINKLNPRSLKAHTHKLNLKVIDEFEFKGNSYHGLAFLTKC
jgi:hypothetical protein